MQYESYYMMHSKCTRPTVKVMLVAVLCCLHLFMHRKWTFKVCIGYQHEAELKISKFHISSVTHLNLFGIVQ